jgi:hypothetical protein
MSSSILKRFDAPTWFTNDVKDAVFDQQLSQKQSKSFILDHPFCPEKKDYTVPELEYVIPVLLYAGVSIVVSWICHFIFTIRVQNKECEWAYGTVICWHWEVWNGTKSSMNGTEMHDEVVGEVDENWYSLHFMFTHLARNQQCRMFMVLKLSILGWLPDLYASLIV